MEKACRLKDEKELKEKMGKKMVKLKSEDCQRKKIPNFRTPEMTQPVFYYIYRFCNRILNI